MCELGSNAFNEGTAEANRMAVENRVGRGQTIRGPAARACFPVTVTVYLTQLTNFADSCNIVERRSLAALELNILSP